MDVRYINPFMGAVKNVMQTMLNLDVEFGKPDVMHHGKVSHDVSGIIGLSGDAVGAVIISFPRPSAMKIAGTFACTTFTDTDEDFADAIGELANMIAGNAKKDLDGLNVSISIPSVIIGHGHEIKATRVVPRLIIPCSTPAGSFVVEVGFKVVNNNTKVSQELVGSAAE